MSKLIRDLFLAGAVVTGAGNLAGCSNVENPQNAAAHINGDGDIEIYDVKSGQVTATTDIRLIKESDRKDFILEGKSIGEDRVPQIIENEDGSVWRGVIVNSRGYTNSVHCNFNSNVCDIGSNIDSPQYKIVEPKTPLIPMTTQKFEF